MTYRVGVRLFVTYMAVGVLPILFAAAFAAVGLYILMGQYTSVRLGSELRRVRWELAHQCEMVLQRAETQGADVGRIAARRSGRLIPRAPPVGAVAGEFRRRDDRPRRWR